MDSLNKRLSASRPKHDSGEVNTNHRNRGEKLGTESLQIAPVPPEELPEEMRSVLESFISSQRPSLADARPARQDVLHASTSGRSQSQSSPTQGYERYDYDGNNDYASSSKWPFDFNLKGKKIPSRTFHTHKVVPRSRPNAKEQLGKRKWHPSRRHGRVIRQEDYDAYAVRGLGQTAQFLNSESLFDLSVGSRRAVKEEIGRAVGGNKLWRWPSGGESKLGKVARKMFCRG